MINTRAMKRLFSLLLSAIRQNEPVLLVGETGCGKTSVCEMYSVLVDRQLSILNCQQNTETADFLGSNRPVRNRAQQAAERQQAREAAIACLEQCSEATVPQDASVQDLISRMELLEQSQVEENAWLEVQDVLKRLGETCDESSVPFAWVDGPLTRSAKSGNLFLIDEISLADDSVLERINSVLEIDRTLMLSEKHGGGDEQIVAHADFKIMATMNPGGDYGKARIITCFEKSIYRNLGAVGYRKRRFTVCNIRQFGSRQ